MLETLIAVSLFYFLEKYFEIKIKPKTMKPFAGYNAAAISWPHLRFLVFILQIHDIPKRNIRKQEKPGQNQRQEEKEESKENQVFPANFLFHLN